MARQRVTTPDMTPQEKRRVYQQRYKSKDENKEKYAQLNRAWISKNRERYNAAKSEYRFKLKQEAIRHYSAGTMRCARCSFSGFDALVLDHINDDGAQHRRELGIGSRGASAGTTMYERLKALGWVDGLQVLCANCNTIKAVELRRGRTCEEMLAATAVPTRWRK